MPYVPKVWADGPAGGTPITAADLNHIEQGVASASGAGELPWLIDVDVFGTAIAQVNWNDIQFPAGENWVHGAAKFSSGAQNDEINFDVVLAAGTWTIEVMHRKSTNLGIYSVQLDGVEVGTIDGYGAAAPNTRSSIANIVVAAAGKKRLKLKMAAKNPSSSSYFGELHHIQLRRTA